MAFVLAVEEAFDALLWRLLELLLHDLYAEEL